MTADLPSIRRSGAADHGDIVALLAAAGLPTVDLTPAAHGTRFWVAHERGELVGTVGVEGTGATALLRSLVVASPWRRLGLGRALVERAEIGAGVAGTTRFVLLTDSARGFFQRLGYVDMERTAAPAALQTSAQFQTLCSQSASCLAKPLPVLIYHNPSCGTSRTVLDVLRDADLRPRVIEYLKSPPDREELTRLIERMGIGVRAVLRQKDTHYHELGLGDAHWSDAALIERMLATPILINRPIVVTPRGVKLCRPSQTVEELLDETQTAALRSGLNPPRS